MPCHGIIPHTAPAAELSSSNNNMAVWPNVDANGAANNSSTGLTTTKNAATTSGQMSQKMDHVSAVLSRKQYHVHHWAYNLGDYYPELYNKDGSSKKKMGGITILNNKGATKNSTTTTLGLSRSPTTPTLGLSRSQHQLDSSTRGMTGPYTELSSQKSSPVASPMASRSASRVASPIVSVRGGRKKKTEPSFTREERLHNSPLKDQPFKDIR